MSTNGEPVSGGGAISDGQLQLLRAAATHESFQVTGKAVTALFAKLDASEARAEAAERERDEAREERDEWMRGEHYANVRQELAESRLAAADAALQQIATQNPYDDWPDGDEEITAREIARRYLDAQPQPTPSPEEKGNQP